jgi:hypothetical protein
MQKKRSIWFFVGLLLAIYGVAICITGLWELKHPLPQPPALVQFHAPVWWGAILAVTGVFAILRSARNSL